jgi:hypothetical protein
MTLHALQHEIPTERARDGRRFHVGIASALLLTALAGFAPSYFLKALTDAPALSLLAHVHAAAFTAWLVLLLVQSCLVAGRRVALHRRLGVLGAALAVAMVPLGVSMAIDAARSGRAAPGFSPQEFMIFPIGQIMLFGVFVSIALLRRSCSAIHRRFMLLASIALMTPAIARLPLVEQRPLPALGMTLCFVLAAMIHDRRSRGRIHRAYFVGGLLLLISGPARFVLAHTEVWRSVAHGLTG